MWAKQRFKLPPRAFINAGIAGHGSADLGAVFLIDQIIDVGSNQVFYPGTHFKWAGQSCRLHTLDIPSDQYQLNTAYDMEGAAFFNIVSRFTSVENIHLLKVISDNPESSFKSLNSKKVASYAQLILKDLKVLISCLVSHSPSPQINIKETLTKMHLKWHITVSQEQQIREKLKAIAVMQSHTEESAPDWETFDNAKKYLLDCEHWLIRTKPILN